MDKKICSYIYAIISVLVLVIVSAITWELFFPDSHLAKVTGLAAFGILCIFLRVLSQGFLIPKPKK